MLSPASPPRHVAIIMDGNGRWASRRGRVRAMGHRAGARSTRAVVESASDLGIEVLTLFAFSSENWNRPAAEVRVLMDLFLRTIRREIADLHKNNVCLRFIGDRRRLSAALKKEMEQAEALTAGNQKLDLLVAIDYGGHWDITRAARQLAQQCVAGELRPEDINESRFAQGLSLANVSAPDLFIRTGEERRVSNFLLWDLAYSELYFCDTLWPDFDAQALAAAVNWYTGRERRYGCIGMQA